MNTEEYQRLVIKELSEKDFQADFIDIAHAYRWKVAHFRSVQTVNKAGDTRWATPVAADGEGFPDLIMLRGDRQLAVELKRENGKTTPKQDDWLAAFKAAGVATYVWKPSDFAEIHTVLK